MYAEEMLGDSYANGLGVTRDYEEALRLLPGVAQVHHNLALVLGKLGRLAEAIAQDEAALRLEPDSREARAHLAWLRRR